MTKTKLDKKNVVKYILLIILGLLFLGNTNNNPDIFIQRVFRPINLGGTTIFYAGLIPMIIIYKGLKGIYICNKTEILRTRIRRIIVMIVLFSIFSNYWVIGLKTYKGFAGGLDSIYCDREGLWLSACDVNESEVRVSTMINLENCSSEDQAFSIKIKVPEEWKNYINEEEIIARDLYLDSDDKIYMGKREKTDVRIEAIVKCKNSTYSENTYSSRSIKNFDFILFNDEEEVMFKGIETLHD